MASRGDGPPDAAADPAARDVPLLASAQLDREPGFYYGFHEDRNRLNRRTMEDSHAMVVNFARVHGQGFFAVYDGHAGRQAAQWCGEHLHGVLADLLDSHPGTPIPELLNETFERADALLANHGIHAGCTAVASLIHVEGDRRVLYTANVGDARAVLCRKGQAIRLSYDHKGCDPFEAKRITDAGGFVLNSRVNGVLAVTRSLGDASMKDLVVGNPYTTEVELTADDEFLILACDGIWDVMSDQEAVNLILGQHEPQQAAELLVHQALENMSTDNLSAIVVRFVHPKRRPSHASALESADSEEIIYDNDETPTPRSVYAAHRAAAAAGASAASLVSVDADSRTEGDDAPGPRDP
ncbi:mgpp2cl-1, protein phosphatase 2C-like protein 1 [Blastocladiella emersonii ATCC 22665]|nr:mgpp2cl-1, protein phosphatase 2C-like protein 1 [Blastocladiella emersonii ATCC 22665]